jgi:hypothetical protein
VWLEKRLKLTAKGGQNTQAAAAAAAASSGGGGSGSRAARQLRQQQSKLCRAGVPQALRARVWLALSESRRAGLMMAAGEGYSQLLARAAQAISPDAADDDGGGGGAVVGSAAAAAAAAAAPSEPLEVTFRSIEADLARTFPDHQMVDTAQVRSIARRHSGFTARSQRCCTRCVAVGAGLPWCSPFRASDALVRARQGRTALRNVLRAFALHRPHIGYCQSMNSLVAMLLVVFDASRRPTAEEDAFWTLALLEDQILPDYHTPSLVGSQVPPRNHHARKPK